MNTSATSDNISPNLDGGTVSLGRKADEMGSFAMQIARAISQISASDPDAKVTLPAPSGQQVGLQEAGEIMKVIRRFEERLSELCQEIGDHEDKLAKRRHDGVTGIWRE